MIEEIGLLGGDYARRLYFVALIDIANLDSKTALPVLWQVGQRMTSDYDRGQVLQRVAKQVKLDQRASQAYVQAMASMKSDYERRRALVALFASAGAAAQGDALVTAIDAIKSSYDKRIVLAEVIARGSLTTDMKRGVLTAAAGIQSDYDRGQVLQAYVRAYGIDRRARTLLCRGGEIRQTTNGAASSVRSRRRERSPATYRSRRSMRCRPCTRTTTAPKRSSRSSAPRRSMRRAGRHS